MSASLPDLLRRVAAAAREGRAHAVGLIVSKHGSAPQGAGSIMFIDDLGRQYGTIGGGCVEADVRRRALAVIADRRSAILRIDLDADRAWDDGLICGGTIEVALAPAPAGAALDRIASDIEAGRPARLEIAVEGRCPSAVSRSGPNGSGPNGGRERITLHVPPRARLYVAGSGHIGRRAALLAADLDFDVTVFDDRPDLLERLPPPIRTVCGPIARRLAEAPLDERTYCLIVTRGHRHDARALAAVLSRQRAGEAPFWVGMIGSARKAAVTIHELVEAGVPREALARVCTPVGLPIGAQSVEEIAVAIAAQLVQVRAAQRTAEGLEGACHVTRAPEQTDVAAGGVEPVGVLLAAGRSERMGRTKQTLPLPGDPLGRTLAAAAFDAINRACPRMIVVVSHDSTAVCESLAPRTFRRAEAPVGAEMFASVLAGLAEARRLDPAAPVLLHLADHPHLDGRTLAAILEAGRGQGDCAVIPTSGGQGGHPVLIPPALIEDILRAAAEGVASLRDFWHAHPDRCLRVPVDDASITADVDFPQDYGRLLQGVS